MHIRVRKTVALGLLVAALACPIATYPVTALGAESTITDGTEDIVAQMTTTAALNVRTGPSTGFSRLFVLKKGTTVTVSDTSDGWAYIQYGDTDGWCSMKYLQVVEGQSENGQDADSRTADTQTYASRVWLNVRSGAGTKYQVVHLLSPGETVTVQTDNVSGWVQVSGSWGSGYCNSRYLTAVSGSSNATTVATSSSDSSTAVGNTANGSNADNNTADSSTDTNSATERISVITEGTVDSDWVAKVQAKADLLPQSVIKWFNSQGNRLSVVDYDLASTYGYSTRICGITVAHSGYSEVKVEPRTNGVNAVIHEIGHSIDYAGTTTCQYSSQSAFTEAFDEENGNISNLNINSVSMNGAPYYPECFAEAFAAYVTQSDFRTSCPKLTAYIDGILATLE